MFVDEFVNHLNSVGASYQVIKKDGQGVIIRVIGDWPRFIDFYFNADGSLQGVR